LPPAAVLPSGSRELIIAIPAGLETAIMAQSRSGPNVEASMRTTNRRNFLHAGTAAAGGIAAFGILTRRADAAEFTWRYVPTKSPETPLFR
jgi:hypothetical protein